jgi:hypothetical protein
VDGVVVSRPLVLACGALVKELRAVLDADGLTDVVDVEYLPAPLHNRPDRIVPTIEERLATIDPGRTVIIGYADCGTGGRLDDLIARSPHRLVRFPGAHCYELFAGSAQFAALHDAEPGTFYLTDFLTRHFDALVWNGLGLDRRPALRDVYFANYRKVVLLSQSDDADLVGLARDAARRLQLEFEHVVTGLDHFALPIRVGLRGAAA